MKLNNRLKSIYLKLFWLIVSIFILKDIKAQQVLANETQVQKFFKTTTYVVLNNDGLSGFDKYLQDAITKYWKITPYKFITLQDFEMKRKDENSSFLMRLDATVPSDNNVDMDFVLLNFVLGSNSNDLSLMPDLGSIILAYSDEDEDNYLYKIDVIIQFMQKNIQYVKENPGQTPLKLANNYNDNKKNIKNYELWLVDEDLTSETNTNEKIKAIYSYKFRIVTHEQLAEAIKNQNKSIAFFFKVGTDEKIDGMECYKFIATVDGQLLFLDKQMISNKTPSGLLIKDLKNIK